MSSGHFFCGVELPAGLPHRSVVADRMLTNLFDGVDVRIQDVSVLVRVRVAWLVSANRFRLIHKNVEISTPCTAPMPRSAHFRSLSPASRTKKPRPSTIDILAVPHASEFAFTRLPTKTSSRFRCALSPDAPTSTAVIIPIRLPCLPESHSRSAELAPEQLGNRRVARLSRSGSSFPGPDRRVPSVRSVSPQPRRFGEG